MTNSESLQIINERFSKHHNVIQYATDLHEAGVIAYEWWLETNTVTFFDEGNNEMVISMHGHNHSISKVIDTATFMELLKKFQSSEMDFNTFCEGAANCGVLYWLVLTDERTCTYFDIHYDMMHIEAF